MRVDDAGGNESPVGLDDGCARRGVEPYADRLDSTVDE
jgi:hypothetical protein